jgi:MFS family permease
VNHRRLRRLVIDVGPLRELPPYRWLWLGQLINNGGREVTLLALPFQIYLLTGSVLAVGGLAAVRLAALVLFALPGGSLADAVDRRRLLLTTQIALAACSLSLGVLALTGHPPLVALYLISFLATGISTVDGPTRRAVVVGLVGPRHLSSALVLDQAGMQGSSIIGPALGGVLIALVGLPVAYFLDALTFGGALIAAWLLPSMAPAGGMTRPGLDSVREGLRFVRSMPILLASFVVDLDAMVFGMPIALFPILAVSTLHGGATELGLLTSAPAVGAFIGALTTGWVAGVRRQGRAVLVAVAVWGMAITAFGLAAADLPIALLCLVVAGAADVISAVFRGTILQMVTPDRLRGRLSAVHLLVVGGGPRLGDIEATAVAAVVGAPASAALGGALCLVGLAVIARGFPELDAYDAQLTMGARLDEAPASTV